MTSRATRCRGGLDAAASTAPHSVMDVRKKRAACTVGWHHWRYADEELMVVRICTHCGRRRYHGPLPGDRRRITPFVTGGLGIGGGAMGGFGGFDGDC